MIYGYCRISTPKQSLERQVRNIRAAYPEAHISQEIYTGTKINRKEFDKILNVVREGDTIVFDSVSRMSRNAEEGFALYQELFDRKIDLVFLKEPHINTSVYRETISKQIDMTGQDVDVILEGVNRYLMILARKQVEIAFDQAQKEVDDNHQRTREGIQTARLNGKQIGQRKGIKLNVKKANFLEEQIKKFNLTAKAFANLKSIVRGFLKRAKKRGLITFSVEEMLDDMDVTEREFKKSRKDDSEEIFYDNEMEKIVNFVKNNPSNGNLAIALMFCTGLRIGEVVTLKHSDFQGMTVTIRRSETRYRKEDGKYDYVVQDHPKSEAGFRTIVIPESYKWLIIRLRSCNPFGEWVFTKRDGKTRCTTNTIRTRMRCICRKLDIPFRSSHKIRKTYGSILLDNEVDTKLVQSQMGHSDISVTEGYYHKDRKKIQQKSDIINSIADFVI